MSPVYEFRTITTPDGKIIRQVVPLLIYANQTKLTLHQYDAHIAVGDLPSLEQKILQLRVADCERSMVDLRALQSGLSLPDKPTTPVVLTGN